MNSREWHLVRRPQGPAVDDDFELVDADLPEPGDDQVLVRNSWLTVDPYMRGRMNDVKSYVPPFGLGEPLTGGAVGVVEQVGSAVTSVAPGDTVLHGFGWRERAVADATSVQRVDADAAPAQSYLGVMGMPGMTAYAGLLDVAAMQPGDTVFVSAAAGAVGSLVGQIARLKGAGLVVGSAGGGDKVRWLLEEAGYAAAFDYKLGDLAGQLAKAAPEGIDVYFDNVGGDHLEAAIGAMRPHGRAALCGAISGYDATTPSPGPSNMMQIVGKRLTLRGFIVGDHEQLRQQFQSDMGEWLSQGRIAWRETVTEGLESTVQAFQQLMSGGNTGKMLVRLDPDA